MRKGLASLLVLVSMIPLLQACGKSEDQIRQEERAKVLAEVAAEGSSIVASATSQASEAKVPAQVQNASPTTAATAGSTSWAGNYNLKGEGAEGDVVITAKSGTPRQYRVSLGMGASNCTGETEGIAVERDGGILSFTSDTSADYDNQICKIEFTRSGKSATIAVSEDYDGCRNWHGAQCTFNGTMKRK
jgi:hypothetical protein